MGIFFVYILKHNIDGTLYKGWTTNLEKRVKNHKELGTKTTADKNGDYSLVWYCIFPTKTQAIKFENYLKSGSGRAFTQKRLVIATFEKEFNFKSV